MGAQYRQHNASRLDLLQVINELLVTAGTEYEAQ